MRWLTLLGLLVALGPAQAQVLRLCAEDEESYPWLLNDRPGLNIVMLRLVEQRLGLAFQIERMPWRRCLLSLRENKVDGGFKASYSAERAAFVHYPLRAGKVDEQRRMLTESYHFYSRREAAPSWDGRLLLPAGQRVGVQSGFSVVGQLKDMGLEVDDGTRVAEAILIKLQKGRIDLAALQTQRGDRLLEQRPEFAQSLARVEPALVSKPYYLVFSQALVARDAALAERVWDAVAAVRESVEYQQALAGFN